MLARTMTGILLIEDEAELGRLVVRELTGAGYEARLARDGAAGLRAFAEHDPDLVILDWMLPILDGLEVLRQLQGFEIPASAWERQVLERRISNYDPKLLDQLCLTGAVGWGRLSAHPAMLEDSAGGTRRVVPTSVAPITFFLRDEAEWLALPSVSAPAVFVTL